MIKSYRYYHNTREYNMLKVVFPDCDCPEVCLVWSGKESKILGTCSHKSGNILQDFDITSCEGRDRKFNFSNLYFLFESKYVL